MYDTLRFIKLEELTDAQRDELKKALQSQRRSLRAALRAVDQSIEALATEPEPTAPAKRKASAKRPARRG